MNKKMIALVLALLLATTGLISVFAEEAVPQPEETQIEQPEQAEPAHKEERKEQPAQEPAEQPAEDAEAAEEGAISTSDEMEEQMEHREVIITSTLGERIEPGDQFELVATLVGFDHVDVALQWQCNDGSGWTDVADETGDTCELEANEQTVNSTWRLKVTVSE